MHFHVSAATGKQNGGRNNDQSASLFTVGIINKNLIIPTEDLRPTSFGPNDIDNIDEAVEVNFGLLSKKAKR